MTEGATTLQPPQRNMVALVRRFFMRHDTIAAERTDLTQAPIEEEALEGPTAHIEQLLCEVLADTLEVERVSVNSDFFDDLGADSLMMAHFCARLRKRDDLPSLSIKDVYQSPTIASLAAVVVSTPPAITPAAPLPASPASPTVEAEPVSKWQYIRCGAMQLLTLFGYVALVAFVAGRGYDWISDASGWTSIYVRSAVFGGAAFLGWCIVPIVAKWVLVGRWKQGEFRIWSFAYFRLWFIKFLVQLNPMVLFAGTPIYVLYLRALGAKIGRGVLILSRSVPVCTDLLTVGDNAIVRKDSVFPCYQAHAGLIQTGPVSLGRDSFVGEATVLEIFTSLGDGAQLGHASALHAGQAIADGEHAVGSPARHRTQFDYRALAPAERISVRRATYSVVQLLLLLLVSLPLVTIIPLIVVELPLAPAVQDPTLGAFSSWTFYGQVLLVSLVSFFGMAIMWLALALTLPRLLNLAIKPDTIYPLYGFHYWAHRGIARLTNIKFFTSLFGDTSYIVHYLYCLGYDVSFAEQTGANFGQSMKHDNPYCVTVGPGTMVADGLSIINADYSNTSFRVSPVVIGSHSFFGNAVVYPFEGTPGDNCLLATKVMVPVEGEAREDVGFLGSPSFDIPRLVYRDREFDDLKNSDEFGRMLAAKNRHNIATMALFLLVRLLPTFTLILIGFSSAILYQRVGASVTAVPLMVFLTAGSLYYVLVERAVLRFQRLQPLQCSIYDPDSWLIERYWKLSWQPILFNGTPFKSFFWRLLGVRVGKRLFDDGCSMVEKTMITIGDDCVLNAGSIIQPHSQEDGSYKSDNIAIGAGCTLGIGSWVHYGVTMGDNTTLAAHSFLMKGTDVPPNTTWGNNPAEELGDHGARTSAVADGRTASVLEVAQ